MPTPIEELIFSDDEHDGGGTNDIEDNVLGETLNEEHPKEVEPEESLPENRRAPSVLLDVETEGEDTDDENGNNVEEFKVQIFFAFDFDNPNFFLSRYNNMYFD